MLIFHHVSRRHHRPDSRGSIAKPSLDSGFTVGRTDDWQATRGPEPRV